MAFCLPRAFANSFLKALQDGRIEPAKLMEMTSEERRGFFAQIVGADNAQEVNALFESKLLLKDQKRGMISWAKKVAGISEPVRRDLLNKIDKLDKVLNPDEEKAFLADLAATKLGTTVTYEEAQKITKLAQKATLERDKPTDNLSGVSNEFLHSASELEHYVRSIKPTTALGSIGKNAAIIARNHLLMNPSTPIKTTGGQIVNSIMDMVTRRIGTLSLKGQNADLAAQANKQAWATFRETGFNTAMMESYEDSGRLGEKANFDVPEGMLSSNPALHAVESGVRWYAKATNKIAIDIEHNYTFTKFYQKAFFDMLNIGATNLARSEGLTGAALKSRSAAIFRDAAKVKPESDVGALLRNQGQMQAARVTSTNETIIGNLALAIKDAMNKHIANGLGDALMPIAKIPANIIWNGIENAGIGIPIGAKDIFEGRAKIQSEDIATRYEGMAQMAGGIQRVARVVGVLGAAAFFSSLLTKQDFRSDNYGNHFVRIGDVWINMEYVSAISPALAGMMTIKKDGHSRDGFLRMGSEYVSGASQGLKSAPGIDELSSLVTSITNSNYQAGVEKYAKDFFTSRGVPAFFHNLFNNRPVNRLFFGAHGVESPQDVHRDSVEQTRAKLQRQQAAQAGRFDTVHAGKSKKVAAVDDADQWNGSELRTLDRGRLIQTDPLAYLGSKATPDTNIHRWKSPMNFMGLTDGIQADDMTDAARIMEKEMGHSLNPALAKGHIGLGPDKTGTMIGDPENPSSFSQTIEHEFLHRALTDLGMENIKAPGMPRLSQELVVRLITASRGNKNDRALIDDQFGKTGYAFLMEAYGPTINKLQEDAARHLKAQMPWLK